MSEESPLEQPYPRPLSGARVKNPPPSLVPARIPLRGQYVELAPQNAELHAPDLFAAGHETDAALKTWDYMTYGPWKSVDDYRATIREQSASFDPIFYAIRPLDRHRFEGQASLMDINAPNGVIEIGHIWFGPQLARTRAATEALYLLIRYAMDELGYRRVQWRCNSLNEKSRQAARRLGFRFEGVFYNQMIFKGRNRDTAWYSILDDEWPEIRAILGTWLDASNFDANGRARSSLFEKMSDRRPGRRGDST